MKRKTDRKKVSKQRSRKRKRVRRKKKEGRKKEVQQVLLGNQNSNYGNLKKTFFNFLWFRSKREREQEINKERKEIKK